MVIGKLVSVVAPPGSEVSQECKPLCVAPVRLPIRGALDFGTALTYSNLSVQTALWTYVAAVL